MANEKRLIDANEPLRKIRVEIDKVQAWRDKKANRKDPLFIDEIYKLDNWLGVYAECADLIADAPTVDAVEVVRCKDCKHFCPYEGEEHKGDCAELVGLESCVYEDDFCSYGERREGE